MLKFVLLFYIKTTFMCHFQLLGLGNTVIVWEMCKSLLSWNKCCFEEDFSNNIKTAVIVVNNPWIYQISLSVYIFWSLLWLVILDSASGRGNWFWRQRLAGSLAVTTDRPRGKAPNSVKGMKVGARCCCLSLCINTRRTRHVKCLIKSTASTL